MAQNHTIIFLLLFLSMAIKQVESRETGINRNFRHDQPHQALSGSQTSLQKSQIEIATMNNEGNTAVHQKTVSEYGILHSIAETYFRPCSLTVFYENSTSDLALQLRKTLSKWSVKMYLMEKGALLEEKTWARSICDGYFFLVDEGTAFVHHASTDHFSSVPYSNDYFPPPLWNYRAFVVILLLGADETPPVDLIGLYNIKKTENLAILQEVEGTIKVWTHVLHTEPIELTAVDSWTRGNFAKGNNIFPRKFDNFYGSKVRVATFELEPSVVFVENKEDNSVRRFGVDIEIINSLSKAKNFTTDYFIVSTDIKWGKKYPNGSWDGITGQVFHELSDIAMCNNFINGLRYKLIDYSFPYNYMPVCFVAPSPKPLPNWQSPTLPFTWDTWVSIGMVLLAGGVLLYHISSMSVKGESIEFKSFSYDYLYILGSLTTRSVSRKPAHVPARIYMGFFWIISFIITTAYSANLVAFLSVVQLEAPISTFEQLAKSDLRVSGNFIWQAAFAASGNKYLLDILAKMQREPQRNYHYVLERVGAGEFAFIQNRQFLELNRDSRFSYGGKSTIRIVEECFLSLNVGLTLPRNSPLTDNLTIDLMKIFESGMMSKWKDEVVKYVTFMNKDKKPSSAVDSSGVSPLSLDHLQGLFYIMGTGYLTAILILALENLSSTRK